jgi:hypothetical protein
MKRSGTLRNSQERSGTVNGQERLMIFYILKQYIYQGYIKGPSRTLKFNIFK